jgi:hypothetical protein
VKGKLPSMREKQSIPKKIANRNSFLSSIHEKFNIVYSELRFHTIKCFGVYPQKSLVP